MDCSFDLYKGKRVLVTGHTGFKGSWLTAWLLELGAEVVGLSDGIPTQPSHFEALALESKIDHVVGDVRDLDLVKKTVGEKELDFVFHLAAQPIVSEAVRDPIATYQTNVMGTANVLEALRYSNTVQAAVIITSDKCYENVEWEYGYREGDHLGGKDPYSSSKACAEIAFHSFFRTYFAEQEETIRLATARAGNVIGGGDWAKDRLIPDCVKAWVEGQPPAIRHLQAVRPWQHVLEPLRGYLGLGEALYKKKEGVNGEAFNFGPANDHHPNVGELLMEIQRYWPTVTWESRPSSLTKKECGLLKLNCDKALHRLGWLPALDLSQTVQMTIDWYREYSRSPHEPLTLQQIKNYQEIVQPVRM